MKIKDALLRHAGRNINKVIYDFQAHEKKLFSKVKETYSSLIENPDMVQEFYANVDLNLFKRTLILTARLTQQALSCFLLSSLLKEGDKMVLIPSFLSFLSY